MEKRCFVAMPIKSPGTEPYKHYRALFDSVIAPTTRARGYDTRRADDFQHAGAITKDIVVPLATWDLVIADLTDLNPNVFYELGVRHALKGIGTIMIMDESQTSIPFDVQAYRVIKFKSDVPGIAALREELDQYIVQIEQHTVAQRDNLVHDWLPGLPEDVLSFFNKGGSNSQIQALNRAQEQLRLYVDRFGPIKDTMGAHDARSLIRAALEDAKAQNLPNLILARAEKLADSGDVTGFLEQLDTLLNLKSLRPDKRMLTRLRYAASRNDLSTIGEAIMDHSLYLYPDDAAVRRERLEILAHSEDASKQQEAVIGLKEVLGITDDTPPKIAKTWGSADFSTLGLMFDAYHRRGLHVQALSIIDAVNQVYPGKTAVLRNYGRALEYTKDQAGSLDMYRQAIMAGDADDTSFIWLGGELYNRSRVVDSAEVYASACILEPDTSSHFAELALSLAYGIRAAESNTDTPRQLPEALKTVETIEMCITASWTKRPMLASTYSRLRSAANVVEIDFEALLGNDNPYAAKLVERRERLKLARHIYSQLSSDLTAGSAVARTRT